MVENVDTVTIQLELPKSLFNSADQAWRDRLYLSRDAFFRAAIRAGVRSPAWTQRGDDAGESIESLIAQGLSPVLAVDYYYVERVGYAQHRWAEIRDTSPQAVSQNVIKAEKQLSRDE